MPSSLSPSFHAIDATPAPRRAAFTPFSRSAIADASRDAAALLMLLRLFFVSLPPFSFAARLIFRHAYFRFQRHCPMIADVSDFPASRHACRAAPGYDDAAAICRALRHAMRRPCAMPYALDATPFSFSRERYAICCCDYLPSALVIAAILIDFLCSATCDAFERSG